MAPMNWTLIFVSVSMLYILCSIKLYFMPPSPSKALPAGISAAKGESSLSWEW